MIRITAVFLCVVSLFAQAPGSIDTIAGTGSASFSGDGGPAGAAALNVAVDVSADRAGNLFIADQYNHRIRKIAPDGIISTVAGTGTPGYSGDGGQAVNAQINTPTGICADAAGNLYIADAGNQRIRKIDPSGIITTLAGTGTKGYGGDGGPAINATFYNPVRVVVDPSGNVLVADQSNHRIRLINPAGIITTFAGNGAGTPANGAFSGDGGPAVSASLNNPTAVTVDMAGVVYIADQFNQRIRKVAADGTITTIAGNGNIGFSGDGGPATAASLNYPGGITVDAAGNLYFNDDLNYRTRRIATAGTISTVAGNGVQGFSGDGGPAIAASLNGNFGVTLDPSGNIYIADSTNNRVREVYAMAGNSGLSVSSAALPGGSAVVAYSQQLVATGGTPPYTWTLAGGSLPPGTSLSSTGVLSGTPTRAGSFTFTIRVTDANGNSAVETVTLTVAAQTLTITTPSPLPSGMATVQYPQQVLSASGGNPPYTFSVPANSLPPGLTLTPGGAISGTPTVAGNSAFTLTVTDSSNPPQTGTASISLPVRPFSADLITSAGSLSFTLAAGATTLPPAQTVQVESTQVTTLLSYSTTITPAETWLSATPGGITPGAFTVSLTSAASSLAPSATPYRTTISVACLAPSPCAGNAQSVAVSLLVGNPSPQLTALTDLLSFTTSAANPQTTTQTLGLRNAGGGTITFTSVTCGQPFCTAGTAPASLGPGAIGSINVTANPAGLSAGYYFTAVTIVSSAGTITVPVTLFIATGSSLSLNPSGVELTMPAGGVAANPDTSFLVNVSGAASPTSQVAFTAVVLPGAPWLTLGATSGVATGNTPGSVSYSINATAAAALTAQAYYGTIRVTSSGAINSPQDFQVVLNVTAANTPQTPDPTPAGLIFISSGTASGTTPPAQIDRVFASSVTAVPYQASASTSSGGSWLSVSPATGTTSAASPAQSNISVNPAGLAPGVYRGSVSYSLAAAAVPTVNVTLVVEASGGASQRPGFGPAPGPDATTACTPTQIVPTQTALVNDFAAPASWPMPLNIQLNDNCGNAVANGQVVAAFSNGDPPLALNVANPASGLYSGTWTPRATGSQVVITATATAPGFAAATTQISGAVAPNVAPILDQNGTLNAFAIAAEPGVPIAPGTIVQIYGSGLAAQTIIGGTIPLLTSLGGTSVIIGGMEAPLYYVSPGQINAQVPFELTAGQPYEVIVSANGALTTPQTIQSGIVSPGIAQYASGYAIAQHAANFGLITDASPAVPGEYVVVYLAGMGATTVPVTSGTASPSSPLDATVNAPTITLNGAAVPTVYFSGLTPTLAGLYQIDLQIPANAPNGDLTLVVNQPGFPGTPVILPVHE